MAEHDVFTLPLKEQKSETRYNSVMVRLARALGLIQPGFKTVTVDHDDLLQQVEARLEDWAEPSMQVSHSVAARNRAHEILAGVNETLFQRGGTPMEEAGLGQQRIMRAKLDLAHEYAVLAEASVAVENPPSKRAHEDALKEIRAVAAEALNGGTVMAGWDTLRQVDDIARKALL